MTHIPILNVDGNCIGNLLTYCIGKWIKALLDVWEPLILLPMQKLRWFSHAF